MTRIFLKTLERLTGKSEDYTAWSILDYDYWKNNYKLVCCDL